jgi:uncharacterized membrane protein
MVAISAFTLALFFIGFKNEISVILKSKKSLAVNSKKFLPIYAFLISFLIVAALGGFYRNNLLILVSCIIISLLCIASFSSKRFISDDLLPLLIFLVSIAVVFQVILLSRNVLGWDINLEYQVFRLTQINGYWDPLNSPLNSLVTLDYTSMLSITLLPTVYSALMGANDEIVFKILYPFIICLLPLGLYRMSEKEFGKSIGLLSAFFFVFTSVAFFGVEQLSLNRQIIGELFLFLSIFLLMNKSMPVTKRRVLLVIFGAALAVSHYSLAFIYLPIIALFFIISKLRTGFDDVLDPITLLLLFVINLSWYSITAIAPLMSLTYNFGFIFERLISGASISSGTAASMYVAPSAFTAASIINLLLTGASYVFLIIGCFFILIKPNKIGISPSPQFRAISFVFVVLLVSCIVVPPLAATLNFTRYFGLALLFLSPAFVLGGQFLIGAVVKGSMKIKRTLKGGVSSKGKNENLVFLLIAIFLGAYFLSQVGFVNRIVNGSVNNFYLTNFDRFIDSNESPVIISLYNAYIPEQDKLSASWLEQNRYETANVYSDSTSGTHVLVSYGLVRLTQIHPLTNNTFVAQNSYFYLSRLNLVNGIVMANSIFYNTSDLPIFNNTSLIYSNGDSAIFFSG